MPPPRPPHTMVSCLPRGPRLRLKCGKLKLPGYPSLESAAQASVVFRGSLTTPPLAHRPPRPVKLLALIQVAVLLGTSCLPGGFTTVSSDGCGCSSDARQAGTCCCSSNEDSCCSKTPATVKSCCVKTKDTAKTCGVQTASSCCVPKSSGDRPRQKSSSGFRSSCPCGATAKLAVITMPRLRCPVTSCPQPTPNGPRFESEIVTTGQLKEAPTPPPPRVC